MSEETSLPLLQTALFEKIETIKSMKTKVSKFIEHYEKTVSDGKQIVPRHAKGGAKALKSMTKAIDEYEEIYEKWCDAIAMDDDALDELAETEEVSALAPQEHWS